MIHYDKHSWSKHLFTLGGSVLPLVLPRALVFAVYSLVIAYSFRRGYVGTIPPMIHAVLGTVLGLMLAFRTNASYDRWWEGRKAWGGVTNRSRDVVRQCVALLRHEDQLRAATLLACFAHALKRQLFHERTVPELERLLSPAEVRALLRRPGAALRILSVLSDLFAERRRTGELPDAYALRIDENLSELVSHLGACQRIQKTPIPFAYVVHLRRFILVYCASLPFAVVEVLAYATPIVMMIIGYALFGVEEIGVQIEDPFLPSANDVDLERLTRNIERDLFALVEPALDSKA
jgi:ion channel-forming bestrophin family protein